MNSHGKPEQQRNRDNSGKVLGANAGVIPPVAVDESQFSCRIQCFKPNNRGTTMLKIKSNRTLTMANLVALVLAALSVQFATLNAGAVTSTSIDLSYFGQPLQANAPALDTRRLYALGMIETGNDDRAVGAAGEVSRYQLSPAVWKSYSKSADYRNPDISLQVARLHWNYLAAYFTEKTGRAPTDFDMYVLWNTRYGYYARKGFSRRQLAPIVQDRAQRFVNLVNRKD
jgi:hypothetical protein